MLIRKPAVSGIFYPDQADELKEVVDDYIFLGLTRLKSSILGNIRALIVPHAGYVYSGKVAGMAYACLKQQQLTVNRIVILGPAHRIPLRGVAISGATAFSTPLGDTVVDVRAREALLKLPFVSLSDDAHKGEHAIEVQLPFLQRTLKNFTLVPLAVGEANDREMISLLEQFADDIETLIVVSTDLSHYHSDSTARALDRLTCNAIIQCAPLQLKPSAACGSVPLRGLLGFAKKHALKILPLDYATSADAGCTPDRVVGYASFVILQ